MFERGERNRRADRARMASLGGYVGRNVGDQPYIGDLVMHDHFFSPYSDGTHVFSVGTYDLQKAGTGAFALTTPTSVVLSTGATASSGAVMSSISTNIGGYTQDASFRTRMKISAIDSTTTLLAGFGRQGVGTISAITSLIDGMVFGAAGDVSTSNFVCCVKSSSVATYTILDGGGGKANIPLDTVSHDVSIVCDSTAAAVRFYVDRMLAATITTDISSSSMRAVIGAANGTTGGTDRSITADYITIAESRL